MVNFGDLALTFKKQSSEKVCGCSFSCYSTVYITMSDEKVIVDF